MLTRDQVRALRDDLQELLDEVNLFEQISGFELKLGNCSYGPTATFELECCPKTADGKVVNKEAESFKRSAKLYGLDPSDLGKEFRSNGETFKVSGLRTKAHKYPVLATRSDGRVFKFPAERVRALIGS